MRYEVFKYMDLCSQEVHIRKMPFKAARHFFIELSKRKGLIVARWYNPHKKQRGAIKVDYRNNRYLTSTEYKKGKQPRVEQRVTRIK